METKVCVNWKTEKNIDNFYNKYRECKPCNILGSTRHYYENKDKISNQPKIYYEKNRDVLLAKSKINQQNRNYERKKYKQQVQELNQKLQDLTQSIELLKTPNSYMTQTNIEMFINEKYSEGPRKSYPTNRTDVYHIDDIWSLDILDLRDYGPKNNRGYSYVLVIIDNFSKFGWTVALKNKNAITINDSFENIIISSKKTKSNRIRQRQKIL